MAETKPISVLAQCPHCGESLRTTAMVSSDLFDSVNNEQKDEPNNRANISPVGNIRMYRINSEQLAKFITEKARRYVPDVKIEVVTRYCEKKRKDHEPHRSYASLRIAFSEDIVDNKGGKSWYKNIGESPDNMRIEQSTFVQLIRMYQYNIKDIDKWLKSYKSMEELEETLGLTEKYINDIKEYARPRRVTAVDNSKWIIFSAAAENVIADMLTDPKTNKLPGVMRIQDVYKISDSKVEFLVYMHPANASSFENPHVRQILMGSNNKNK